MGIGGSTEFEVFAEGELEADLHAYVGHGDISAKKLLEQGYQNVIQSVIRPARQLYTINDLGPTAFALPIQHCGSSTSYIVRRTDLDLKNDRELHLRCSHWQLFETEHSTRAITAPCVVYLHSNIGSRLDSSRIRDLALVRGLSVFAFDCSGSGLSDGVYVTCGWNETKDLHAVLKYLDQDTSVESICFYAHSMGTFPAIVNAAWQSSVTTPQLIDTFDMLPMDFVKRTRSTIDKPIRGMVLDGGYSTMTRLIEELLLSVKSEGFKVPLSLLKVAAKIVQQSIKKRTDVDLTLLRPIDFVPTCDIPAMFIAGESDRYVSPAHSEQLHANYDGPSGILKVQGEHYTLRTQQVYQDAMDFLYGATRSKRMKR